MHPSARPPPLMGKSLTGVGGGAQHGLLINPGRRKKDRKYKQRAILVPTPTTQHRTFFPSHSRKGGINLPQFSTPFHSLSISANKHVPSLAQALITTRADTLLAHESAFDHHILLRYRFVHSHSQTHCPSHLRNFIAFRQAITG